jgi:hypothetical protein
MLEKGAALANEVSARIVAATSVTENAALRAFIVLSSRSRYDVTFDS